MPTLTPRKGSLARPAPLDPDTLRADPYVVCPVRVSTDHQVYGLEAQQTALLDHARRHSLHIAGLYPDEISAKENPFLERPAVRRMFEDMRRENIRRILITKVDRAFRSTADFLITCKKLDASGIIIQVADLGLDSSTAHGKMVIGILAQLGEWELTMRSDRQLAAFQAMRSRRLSCSGSIRYGWEPDPASTDPLQLRPVPEEQEILREIITLHQQSGLTPGQIADLFQARGTPKTYRRWRVHGITKERTLETSTTAWTKRGIASILEHAELA